MRGNRTLRTMCGLLVLVVAGLAGCGSEGPETAYVEGTVTLDGEPLEGALVTFIPEKGRPAYGRTHANGWYELQYTRDEAGALLGKNSVKINTERTGDPDAEDPALQENVPERVPARYNVDTELTADVESGSNTFDFALTSEGDVISEQDLRGNAALE